MALGVRMANCPKCNSNTQTPLKTWKIKQTPIALYECPVCKAKWRSRILTETVAVTPVKAPEPTAVRTEVKASPKPLATPQAVSARASTNQNSGIRRLFSVLFGL